MTADIRVAAQREAEKRWPKPIATEYDPLPYDELKHERRIFIEGVVWAVARVTPTREQLIEALAARHWDRDSGEVEHWADLTDDEKENVIENYIVRDSVEAIIRLMTGLASGERMC